MPKQFEKLRAAELFCPKCGVLQPVRERLLLVLPGGNLNEYRCTVCAESLGTHETQAPPVAAAPPAPLPRPGRRGSRGTPAPFPGAG